MVSLWYEGIAFYNYSTNKYNAPPRKACGYYTQVSLLLHPVSYSYVATIDSMGFLCVDFIIGESRLWTEAVCFRPSDMHTGCGNSDPP